MAPAPIVFPWEVRDVDDQAEAHHNHHLRAKNKVLHDENQKLKRLLRENGIVWSPIAAAYQRQMHTSGRVTRSSLGAVAHTNPYLPTEVLLRILKYAMTSPEPIIDPLSKLKPENLTSKERARGNQIAIHFMSTSRAMYNEGSRILWEQNTFIFTTHEALRTFAELDMSFRKKIKRVNFRIIAQFYDDKKRVHKLDRSYHPSLKKDIVLRVNSRVDEKTYARSGFRCYSWSQITDFLRALRPPFDPKQDKRAARPRLLPALESLRIDLVNYMDDFLPICGVELHDMASHELGCTLNELQVTGLPIDEAGGKASTELTGLLKDEGLFLAGLPAYIQQKSGLKPLPGYSSCARVVRAWKTDKTKKGGAGGPSTAAAHDDDSDSNDDMMGHHHHPYGPQLPPAPQEEGHPISYRNADKTIWKRVPFMRDSDTRNWVEFCRNSGYPMEDVEELIDSDDELGACPCCGEPHSGSSFLDFLAAEEDVDFM